MTTNCIIEPRKSYFVRDLLLVLIRHSFDFEHCLLKKNLGFLCRYEKFLVVQYVWMLCDLGVIHLLRHRMGREGVKQMMTLGDGEGSLR